MVTPAGSKLVLVTVSAAEMLTTETLIVASDPDNEWGDMRWLLRPNELQQGGDVAHALTFFVSILGRRRRGRG